MRSRAKVSAALSVAVLAGLAAACSSSSSPPTCQITQTKQPIGCVTYTATVSDRAACGFGSAALTSDQCNTVCAFPDPLTGGQVSASCEWTSDTSNDVGCMIVCGKVARTSFARRKRDARHSPLQEHLAGSVWLEAASIDAFYTLANELSAHGAPRRLVDAALVAARDEARHTKAMSMLAKRHGVVVPLPRVRRRPVRAVVDVAIENAVEGVVHETFGAALARFQSMRARDALVRTVMRAVARDEAMHARLAEDVAKWAAARLTKRENDRVRRARDRAVTRLVDGLRRNPIMPMALGLPNAPEALAVADVLRRTLWC